MADARKPTAPTLGEPRCKWCGMLTRYDGGLLKHADGTIFCSDKNGYQQRAERATQPVVPPTQEAKTDAYEVYGSGADSQGWDSIVFKTLSEAIHQAELDADSLAEGEEVRIVYRKYTQAQWDEVVYE